MSALRELSPINQATPGENQGSRPKTKAELEQENRNLVNESVSNGNYRHLTAKQQHIIEIRGYFGKGPLRAFRQLEAEGALNTSYQGAGFTEVSALKTLRRLKAEKQLKEFISENPELSTLSIARTSGYSPYIIDRLKNELRIPRRSKSSLPTKQE